MQRSIAHTVRPPPATPASTSKFGSARFTRAHGASVTAIALSPDASSAFSVVKDGSALRIDVETGARTPLARYPPPAGGTKGGVAAAAAPWARRAARTIPPRALLAVAASDDGSLVAAGGGDGRILVWDARTGHVVRAHSGHTAAVTGLSFRPATRELYSSSLDATLRLWSLDDGAFVDALHGHQAGVLCVAAAGRGERAVSGGADRTARLWKIADEAQLIYRAPSACVDAVASLTASEWVTGDGGGGLALWSALKKRPAARVASPHAPPPGAPPALGWIQSIAVSPGADLVATGAGDGAVRLWAARGCGGGGGSGDTTSRARGLDPLFSLPSPGFVNGLALSADGTVLVAGLGPEPRLGRWAVTRSARPGVAAWRLPVEE